MSTRLLATKFHIPPWRATGVSRPRLLEQLDAGLHEQRKLTLISAPAGYGKTTLVTEWLRSLANGPGVAWLSLDEDDNNPARFIRYWLAAFHRADESILSDLEALFDMPQLPPVQSLLDGLLNDLAGLESPLVLTLDDYYIITNSQIHEALAYFVDHQPAQVHLVITTRADPPLPLARLRARGLMTEIRARDLRFTPEEAHQFFDLSLNLSMAEETLRTLDQRTEGWAVGLQLAALALQRHPDPAAFVEAFRGSHRYILDYLAEEVIHQQDEHIQTFLTQTSVLERFNGRACNALTGRTDSQTVIEYLDQANLFVIPLDDERSWYRYHHLFSDYLRSLLSKSQETALYQEASRWCAANDLMPEAVHYALASGDHDFAADVIGQALKIDATWSAGNLAQWLAWLEALPPQAFENRPQLSLNASRILYLSGRFDQAETFLKQTEESLKSQPALTEADREEMLALTVLYRGAIASVHGDSQRAIEQIHFAQARLPADNHLAHARAFFGLGLAYEIADQIEPAAENYLKSSREAEAAGVLFLAIHGLCAAAQVQIKQARLQMAERTCQSAIQLAGGARLAPLGLAWSILGGIAIERNELESAEKYLQDGIALSRQGGLTDDLLLGLAYLARLHAYQGDPDRALAIMQEAQTALKAYGVERMNVLADAYVARLQLYLGQEQAAAQWAAEALPIRTMVQQEFVDLTLGRVLLATDELGEIPDILHPVLEKAEAAGRTQTSMEAMLLLGLFHHARHETLSALNWLEKSIHLAAPQGYLRIFLDEGQALFELLPKLREAAPEFVDSLLEISQTKSEPQAAFQEQLLDPLTDQEMRVLKLIMAGMSNQEIADELVISVGTAKWHVHNLLQKMDASSRAEAIARALELGI